jgi:hypothetical protein
MNWLVGSVKRGAPGLQLLNRRQAVGVVIEQKRCEAGITASQLFFVRMFSRVQVEAEHRPDKLVVLDGGVDDRDHLPGAVHDRKMADWRAQ